MSRTRSITGTIFDIKKFAIHDGPGIRTTVFFRGCPLDCWWCHNPEGRSTRLESVGYDTSVDNVLAEVLKDTIFYNHSGGGVTFSGGEPMMQIDFLVALLAASRGESLHTVVDTCGYAPREAFEQVVDLVDLFLYDLKIMEEDDHTKYTGQSNKLILENLVFLAEAGADVVVRVPIIPGLTDSEENLSGIRDFLSGFPGLRRVCLLPHNMFAADKYRRYNLPDRLGPVQQQSRADVESVAEPFRSLGYEVQVGG